MNPPPPPPPSPEELAVAAAAGPVAPPPAPGAATVHPLRDALFADLAPAEARATYMRGGAATAWLVALANAADAGDAATARSLLAQSPPWDKETRFHLQGWSLARQAGLAPGADAKDVLGVVVDMGLDEGLDTLAAFADGSARYLNHSGSGVVWEVPDMAVGQLVRQLLGEAAIVVTMGAPLEGERLGAPPRGHAMISVLTRGGIYVGAGPQQAMSADPRGGPVIRAATELLNLLVQRAAQANQAVEGRG